MQLKPTLWRTCRVLANELRLQMLRCVLRKSLQTVAEIAARTGVTESVASDYLRLLQSRGLIRSERCGRLVLYVDRPDPSVPGSSSLLEALRTALGPGEDALRNAVHSLTAFTHPRRIMIVRALPSRGIGTTALRQATGISSQALSRHLAKLQRRSVIEHERGWVRLSTGVSGLMRCLLRLARED